jgi:hypothetical protein
MNLKQLLRNAGISNDIIKEVERKAQKTTAEQEIEHQEKAMAMAKMMINDALRSRKAQEEVSSQQIRKMINPDEK